MIGLPGATLANIDAVGSLIPNTALRGVTGMGRDRGQVSGFRRRSPHGSPPSQALTRALGMAVAS